MLYARIANGKRKMAVRKVVRKNNKNVDKNIFCALLPMPLSDKIKSKWNMFKSLIQTSN